MKPSGRRRGFRSWFVEPYRQVKLGLLFLVLNLIFAGLILSTFGYYIWDIYQALATYFHLSQDQGAEILQKLNRPLIFGSFLMLTFVAASILIAVRYTHRIYGPLVSIHRFLDELQQGVKVTPLVLRESDQLKTLAEKLNALTEAGRAPTLSLNHVYRYLDELLDGQTPDPLQIREGEAYRDLVERLNSLGERLRQNRAG